MRIAIRVKKEDTSMEHSSQVTSLHIHSVARLDAQTHSFFLVEGNRQVYLTKKEYEIFQTFFENGLLSDEQIAREVFASADDKYVRQCLEKHIDHLRVKIRAYGLDIYRISRYGYILLSLRP